MNVLQYCLIKHGGFAPAKVLAAPVVRTPLERRTKHAAHKTIKRPAISAAEIAIHREAANRLPHLSSQFSEYESIRAGEWEREAVARAEREAAQRRAVAGDGWLVAGGAS
jgi:hypothetical protein